MSSRLDDEFVVGHALVEFSKSRPDVIAPLAEIRLNNAIPEVRLVSRACAVSTGKTTYDAVKLETMLMELIAQTPCPAPKGLDSIWRSNGEARLLRVVGLAALKGQPAAKMNEFVDRWLSKHPFTVMSLKSEINETLRAQGVERPAGGPAMAERGSGRPSWIEMSAEWTLAQNRVMRVIAKSALGVDEGSSGISTTRHRAYPQFSALLRVLGYWSCYAEEVDRWERPFAENAVREVIRAVISISDIDETQIALEAREIIDRLDRDFYDREVSWRTGFPDILPPNWEAARPLGLDRQLVETAFLTGSEWLTSTAAHLLEVLPATDEDVVHLIRRASGDALRHASQLLEAQVGAERWRDIVLERLATGPEPGTQHLLTAFTENPLALAPATGEIIEQAFRSQRFPILEAAVLLCRRWLDQGGTFNMEIAKDAYRSSLSRTLARGRVDLEGYTRSAILELLAATGSLDRELYNTALGDPDWGTRGTASKIASRRVTMHEGRLQISSYQFKEPEA